MKERSCISVGCRPRRKKKHSAEIKRKKKNKNNSRACLHVLIPQIWRRFGEPQRWRMNLMRAPPPPPPHSQWSQYQTSPSTPVVYQRTDSCESRCRSCRLKRRQKDFWVCFFSLPAVNLLSTSSLPPSCSSLFKPSFFFSRAPASSLSSRSTFLSSSSFQVEAGGSKQHFSAFHPLSSSFFFKLLSHVWLHPPPPPRPPPLSISGCLCFLQIDLKEKP